MFINKKTPNYIYLILNFKNSSDGVFDNSGKDKLQASKFLFLISHYFLLYCDYLFVIIIIGSGYNNIHNVGKNKEFS